MRTNKIAILSSMVITSIAAAFPLSVTSSVRADEPRIRIEVPRYDDRDRDYRSNWDQSNLTASMARLRDSINRMNEVLRRFRPEDYNQLRNEIATLNDRVDSFQTLVDHHERDSILRDAYIKVEQAAGGIDLHMRTMNADRHVDREVNDAWQNVSSAFLRVGDDIGYRTASER